MSMASASVTPGLSSRAVRRRTLRTRRLVGGRQDGLDAGDVPLGDLGDVLGPVFPVVALADLVDDPGVDGVPPVLDREEGALDALGLGCLALAAGAVAEGSLRADADPMMLSGRFLFSSIWLMVALKRSSWARRAWRTCQTTLYLSLSASASLGVHAGGDADGQDDVAVASCPAAGA